MSFNPNENSKPGKLPDLPGLTKPTGIGKPKNSLPPLPGSLPQPKQNNTPNTNGGLPGLPAFPTAPKTEPSPEPIVPNFAKPQPSFAQPSFAQPSQMQQPIYAEEQVEQVEQPQPTRNLRAALADEEETDTSSKRNRQDKKQSKKTLTKKSSKKSAYSGKRRNVIYARIVVFGIVGILMVAGIFSFLPKSSGLTASDKPLIISAIRENLNYTDFPRAAGEGFAEAFTSVYLNYDPAKIKERSALLANFVNPNVLKNIDTRPATAEETAAAATNTPSSSNAQNEGSVDIPATSSTQTVTDGPYVVGSLMYKGGNAAMFTVMAEVNNNNWIFIQIPMYYNKDTGGLSVSGSLTFSPPILSTDVPEWEGSGSSWAEDDQEVKKLVESDITEYIKAWTASDDTNIQRFLVKENGKSTATKNASEGLESRVKFVGINNLSVEEKAPLSSDSTAEQKADFYTRQATVTVTFLEPSSNLIYTQQYRLILEYVNEDWFVKDINNVSTLVDRDATIAKQNEAKNKSN